MLSKKINKTDYYESSFPKVNSEPEEYIVQNITPGPHCINDIDMTFGPGEVKDLTWEDPRYIRRSTDLRASLQNGILMRISKEQWNTILEKEMYFQQKALKQRKEASRKRMSQVEVNDKIIDAETLNLGTGTPDNNNFNEVEVENYANNPLTYVQLFQEANQRSIQKGYGPIDAKTFASEILQNANKIIKKQEGVISGTPSHGKATVAVPPRNDGDNSDPATIETSNYNRDNYIANIDDHYQFLEHEIEEIEATSSDDGQWAETIDLTDDINNNSGVRRLE